MLGPATVADLTERELIASVRRQLPPPPDWLIVGIGDDAAVVEPERNRLEVLTVDSLVEGVHFDRRFTPPDAIGHRALAVNLSDLAAMGAEPRLALLSLALPPSLAYADFEAMVAGIAALASKHRLHVAGGNLTRSPGPLMLDITVVGTAKRRGVLRRAGARPGHELFVTGTLGAATAGLAFLREASTAAAPSAQASADSVFWSGCVGRYLYPEPRVRVGLLLGRNRAASACIDLSDGLADGVRQIAEASGVGCIIDGDALPIDSAARTWFESRGQDPVVEAMRGGDDYELTFAVAPKTRGRLLAAIRHGGVPLVRVGVCTLGRDLVLRRTGSDGRVVEQPIPEGFSHFR